MFNDPQAFEIQRDLEIQRNQLMEAKKQASAFIEACREIGIRPAFGGGIEVDYSRFVASLGEEQAMELKKVFDAA